MENRPAVIHALLKQQLPLQGAPVIYIKDGNYNDNRELYMVHVRHPNAQQELAGDYQRGALEKVFRLWGALSTWKPTKSLETKVASS